MVNIPFFEWSTIQINIWIPDKFKSAIKLRIEIEGHIPQDKVKMVVASGHQNYDTGSNCAQEWD